MANPCLSSPLLPPSPSPSPSVCRGSSPRLLADVVDLVLLQKASDDLTITLSTTTPPPTPPPTSMTLPTFRRSSSQSAQHSHTHYYHHHQQQQQQRSDIEHDNSPSPSPVSPDISEYASESNNPSPASHTLSMNSNDGHDTHTSSSSDAPSNRMSAGQGQQQQLQAGTGKGGCWTCRIRRKKCDEQRTNDSCQTCIRLNIDCLGWGPKRPAWMRDKQAVERHKAAIKDKLSKAGMIRGVPRTPATPGGASGGSSSAAGPSRLGPQGGSSSSSSFTSRQRSSPYFSPGASAHPHHHHRPLNTLEAMHSLSTAPASAPAMLGHETDIDYFPNAQHALAMHNVQDHYPRTITMPGGANSPHSPFPTMNPYSSLSSSQSQHPQQHHQQSLHLQGTTFQSFSIPTPPPVPSQAPSLLDDTMFSATTSTQASSSALSPTSNDPLLQKEFVDPHIMYYLNNVLPLQYTMASDSLTNLMHNIMTNETTHYSAVTHASCALASLHNKSIRVARGLDHPDLDPQYSTASQFYNKAYYLLFNDRTVPVAYSELDAFAALQLVSYWLLSGGTGHWPMLLNVASEWLASTGITTHENPRMAFFELNDVAKFTAKITMWFDIFSSVTSVQAPRFMVLYQRLLSSSGNGFWTRGEHDLHMESLMGCPDDVLLIFAEVADLAAWKAREQAAGTLSVRMLVHKGEAIEARLRNGSSSEPQVGASTGLLEPISAGLVVASNASSVRQASPANRQGSNASSSSSSASSPPSIAVHMTTSPEASLSNLPSSNTSTDMYRSITNIFRETASLYLQTVINEPSPVVPETANAVTSLMTALQAFPPSLADRALTLPLCLAGCMASLPTHREYISKRLAAQDDAVWSGKTVRMVIAQVWATRELQAQTGQGAGSVVDWRTVIHDYLMHEGVGPELLLV